MNYNMAMVFTKHTNLLPYFDTMCSKYNMTVEQQEREQQYYARMRDVKLLLKVRNEATPNGYRIFCKIECPINPLPVKGDFEVPSVAVVQRFLINNGWTYSHKVTKSMLQ